MKNALFLLIGSVRGTSDTPLALKRLSTDAESRLYVVQFEGSRGRP